MDKEDPDAVRELQEWLWALYRAHAFNTSHDEDLGQNHEAKDPN